MKPIVLFAAFSLAVSAVPQGASANPKGLGPSAMEAARLKARPPANYLSHYLPDDRYKIAGGVWKFVSTDLDTYYHVPSSKNMMRQPATNVIGFANARDAEEAGYVADPTDGTANAVASANMSMGGATVQAGQNPAEQGYSREVTALLAQIQQSTRDFLTKVVAIKPPEGGAPPGFIPPELRQALNEMSGRRRTIGKRLSALRPPPRFKKFHSLLIQGLRMGNASDAAATKMLTTGDLSQLTQMQEQFTRALTLQRDIVREGTRLGINPTLLR